MPENFAAVRMMAFTIPGPTMLTAEESVKAVECWAEKKR